MPRGLVVNQLFSHLLGRCKIHPGSMLLPSALWLYVFSFVDMLTRVLRYRQINRGFKEDVLDGALFFGNFLQHAPLVLFDSRASVAHQGQELLEFVKVHGGLVYLRDGNHPHPSFISKVPGKFVHLVDGGQAKLGSLRSRARHVTIVMLGSHDVLLSARYACVRKLTTTVRMLACLAEWQFPVLEGIVAEGQWRDFARTCDFFLARIVCLAWNHPCAFSPVHTRFANYSRHPGVQNWARDGLCNLRRFCGGCILEALSMADLLDPTVFPLLEDVDYLEVKAGECEEVLGKLLSVRPLRRVALSLREDAVDFCQAWAGNGWRSEWRCQDIDVWILGPGLGFDLRPRGDWVMDFEGTSRHLTSLDKKWREILQPFGIRIHITFVNSNDGSASTVS